jgi:uncharacterized circularly permuted ATP-grasp superfamily protein
MTERRPEGLLHSYDSGGFYCEVFGGSKHPVSHTEAVRKRLDGMSLAELRRRAQAAERELYNLGVTFTVYTSREQIDRILPFDVIPRVLSAAEWQTIEQGVIQRVTALNRFIEDVYHDQKILRDGTVPADLVLGNSNYRPQMREVEVPFGTYVTICGVDIVRGGDGRFYVLEDNARTPSGVSYVVENRHLTQRAFPDLMHNVGVRSVSNYGQRLIGKLGELAEGAGLTPSVVLLSPGVYNSAYFEHVFLAREMGVPLVEGRDLLVRGDRVYMKTTGGLQPVNVIYRRIDDNFLDPEAFNPQSMLGVPGLMRAYRAGNVVLANAVGTGIADDKAVYAYMPRIIRYYLGEDAILPNVETHICREAEGLEYTLENIEKMVVKPVGESGGYGLLIGPHASRQALAEFRRKLRADPANYISQPVVQLSVCPTVTRGGIEPRHVDLRPFAVTGKSTWVLPGGLTRVALRKGSLVVNSSQGGGSKDTWVLE